jgi:hypothetical protein
MNNTTMGFITSQTVNEAVQDLATIDWIGIPWLATFDIDEKTKDEVNKLVFDLIDETIEFEKIIDNENDQEVIYNCLYAIDKISEANKLLANYKK